MGQKAKKRLEACSATWRLYFYLVGCTVVIIQIVDFILTGLCVNNS